ncbi:MAG: AAA family ATPase [Mucilaginibacter sp.]
MKLDEVIINNFRQYLGEQTPLRLARSKEKNVTVIYGANGAGKSNLFKAINWCIYGRSIFEDEGASKGSLINKEAIHRAKVGERVTTNVKVSFVHEGERFILSRTVSCIKISDQEETEEPEEFLLMRTTATGETDTEPNPTGIINSILPENVRTYFLFDGEKIENFSKPGSAEDIRNAIYNILKLEILTRSKQHLDLLNADYRKELKAVASEHLQKLLDRLDTLKTEKELKEGTIKNATKQIEAARKQIKDIDKTLDSLKESHTLQKERERLENLKKDKGAILSEQVAIIQSIAGGPVNNISKMIVATGIDLLDTKRIKGEIPSKIKEQFLADLLESHNCICGRDFEEGSEPYHHLVSLQASSLSTALEEEVLTLINDLKVIQSEESFKSAQLGTAMQRRSILRGEIDDLEAEIGEIGQKLKSDDLLDVRKLEEQRENYQTDISNYMIDRRQSEIQLETITEEISKIETDIKRAEKNKDIEVRLSNCMAIAQKTAHIIDEVYKQYGDKMRIEIEQLTKTIFDRLIWKEGQFKDIALDENYNLLIYDRWGRPASPELSAGERQVLSLSFIAAMARASGGEAPLVMDTPFGRLSRNHRERITQNIPALADQLVLFVTDEEMTDELKRILSPRTGRTYHLVFDNNLGCTSLKYID